MKASIARRLALGVAAVRVAQERADQHVFGHAHILERHRHLEAARDAEPGVRLGRRAGDVGAVEAGCVPAVGAMSPARQLKNVLLPAPFGPISPTISPSRHRQVGAVDRAEAAERLDDAARLKQHGGAACVQRCDAAAQQAAGLEAGDQQDDGAVDDDR